MHTFIEFDYEGLIEKEGRGRKPRHPKEYEEDFKDSLDKVHEEKNRGRVTVGDIQKLLIEDFDCNYTHSGVYTLLDRMNIVWISGRSKHPKHFQDVFHEEIDKLKENLEHDKIEVWWQDESRVGQ